MIGILCEDVEKIVVQEFFELFKTPWEYFVEGRSYDVVISTQNKKIDVITNLLIVYSSKKVWFDSLEGITVCSELKNLSVEAEGKELPIYGNILSFKGTGEPLVMIKGNSEVVGFKIDSSKGKIVRVGYDLIEEVTFLLSVGQPIENAYIPTLEIHIMMLRNWILDAGIPLVEIPPVPTGYNFIACLTHDVDFLGISKHKLDHTMWGFIYRASVVSLFNVLKGRLSLKRLILNWKAVFSLPFVYLGFCKDFWIQFGKFLEIEKDLKSTFFLIPFKNRAGKRVSSQHPERRATRYDITDMREWVDTLIRFGYEIGVHGIDAWHSYEKAKEEFKQVFEVIKKSEIGIRMHWLCFNQCSPEVLENASFCYDSTFGYNETVGYLAGTTQVFRPFGVRNLLELPLHIQDMALFSSKRLGLTEDQAWRLSEDMFNNLSVYGGVLTILWHMRSLAPERLWGDFYVRLLEELRVRRAWIGTALQVVEWFRRRRALSFREACFDGNKLRLSFTYDGKEPDSNLKLRIHLPRLEGSSLSEGRRNYVDIPWNGEREVELSF